MSTPPSKEEKFNHVTSPAQPISPPFSRSLDASVLVDLSSRDTAKELLPKALASVTEDCEVVDGGANAIDVG